MFVAAKPNSGGGGGSLPLTGVDVGLLTVFGATAILAGFLMVLIGRRRRIAAGHR